MESNLVRRTPRALLLAFAAALTLFAVTASAARADDPAAGGGGTMEIALQKGDRGAPVKAVQRKLRVKADGVFGAGTARAVKAFQKRRKLDADGVVGPLTRDKLGLDAFAASDISRKAKKRKGGSKPPTGDAASTLEKIAQCESGGDITAVSKNGLYYGKYQFSKSTWKANGGQGDDPSEAAESEQDRVALKLYKAEGTDPWPVCGANV